MASPHDDTIDWLRERSKRHHPSAHHLTDIDRRALRKQERLNRKINRR